MKLDYSTSPPTAWKVEDGEWMPIDSRDVMQCKFCKKWFVNTNLLSRDPVCSTGCRLRYAEKSLKK